MPDKKLTEVDASTSLADSDKLIGNIGNSVKQITLTNLVNIIKNKIGSLKNPHALTFTGAVNDIYDGSAAKTINIPTSSGGGSGTTNYTNLTNKPQINGVELSGNKTLDDLNIQPKGNYLTEVPSEYVTETELNNKGYATTAQLGNKLDKNQGSSNSGKFLSVGSDGNVTLVNAPQGGGNSEKEWTKIAEITVQENDSVYEYTDLDNLTEIFIYTVGLMNISTAASGLKIAINDGGFGTLDTQIATGGETRYQKLYFKYNGLFWIGEKTLQSNNEQNYYAQYTNLTSPYSVKLNTNKCTNLKLTINASQYALKSGTIYIYGR